MECSDRIGKDHIVLSYPCALFGTVAADRGLFLYLPEEISGLKFTEFVFKNGMPAHIDECYVDQIIEICWR